MTLWVTALVTAALGSLATAAAASINPLLGVAVAVSILGVLWFVLPRRSEGTPRTLAVFLLAFYFSSVMPTAASAVLQLSALAIGYVAWIAQPAKTRRGGPAVAISACIVVLWAMLVFHPNVPSLDVGLLGLRKTVLCVAGVALGSAIPSRLVPHVEVTIVKVTAIAVGVSTLVHLFVPSLEQIVSRGADQYTALYGGETRLQGFFAGPFHVAFATLLLFAWAFARWSTHRALALIVVPIAGLALALTLVRTAFVALAIVAVIAAIVSPSVGKAIRRLVVLVGGGVLVVAVWVTTSPSASTLLASILNVGQDTRYLGRLPGYQEGLSLFASSPIFGWGAGSAGDTLNNYFVNGQHITSHNIALKVAVEGGLLGLMLWIALIVVIVRLTPARTTERTLVAGVLAALIGLGLTVASVETLPVSFVAFLLIGLHLERTRERPPSGRARRGAEMVGVQ